MLRWLSFFGAIALVAIGVVFYVNGGPPGTLITPPRPAVDKAQAPAGNDDKVAHAGDAPAAPAAQGPWKRVLAVTPKVIIPDARLTAISSPQVPSMRDGQILFLGRELRPGEEPPKNAIKRVMSWLVVEVLPADVPAGTKAALPGWVAIGDKWYRPLGKDDEIKPNRVKLYRAEKTFVPVDEGSILKENELLAVIDPVTAIDDLAIKLAKLDAAEADRAAEEKQRDEYRERWQRADLLYKRGAGSLEDATAAKLAYDYHVFETIHKQEDLKVAGNEMRQAETLLELHMVRSKINGEVKQVSKHKGEAVRSLETVMEMQDHSKLRIRGRVDLQDLDNLPDPRNPNDPRQLYVEARRLVAPKQVLTGHFDAVVGVAVSKDGQIVSVSEDRTARVWDKDSPRAKERLVLEHPAAVRCVACSPPELNDRNLFLTGAADGVARLYDLAAPPGEALVRSFTNGHKAAINCLAFSPDGRWAVTGDEDRRICLWDVNSGELSQRFPEGDKGHKGGVTSLTFLEVGAGDQRRLSVISAGRDNTLIVWPLSKDGSPEKPIPLPNRGGEVLTLGGNGHKDQMLFDQGRELRVLSSENGALVGSLTSPNGTNFTRVALFSPAGNLILASNGPGRLGLWRAPTTKRRGHELEQLVWTQSRDEQANTNCGAFDPSGKFLVTGTQGRNVIVWPMPSEEDVAKRELTARIIAKEAEVTAGQVRVTAELDNPGYLLPGDSVTLVVYPDDDK
jgi:WD40 repeat protein